MVASAVARGGRLFLVLAAAQAVQLPHGESRRVLGLTYIHFHKAGGSSLGDYLSPRVAGWTRVRVRLWWTLPVRARPRVPSRAEITDYRNWTDAIAPAIEGLQLANGSGTITFGDGNFPVPHITAALSCATALVTSIRRPFERWASQYERELQIRCKRMPPNEFPRCALAYNVSHYATAPNERGGFRGIAWPNFYVRAMLGRPREAVLGGVTTAQLEQAQGLLKLFDAIVYVEQPDDVKLAILATRLPRSPRAVSPLPASYPHSSNNWLHHGHGPVVAAYQALRANHPDALDPRAPANRARFNAENGPDEAFYAFGKVLSDAMAAELTRRSQRRGPAWLLADDDSEPGEEQPKAVPSMQALGAPTPGECRAWQLWLPGRRAAGAADSPR